jgi:hypothetical protein
MKTYLRELRGRLAAFAQSLRFRRQHGDQLEAEVCLDIVTDADRSAATAARRAYTAEQADIEAQRLIRVALSPRSPGGAAITRAEARPILRNIRNSARHTHAIVEQFA